MLADEAGAGSYANVPRAAYGRSSSLISLRYPPQPHRQTVRWRSFEGSDTHTAHRIMSMRCLTQRHQGGAVAISDAGDSRVVKYRVGMIPTRSDQ